MYLHIGEDFIISIKNIVTIMDIEYATIMRDSRNFLREAEQNGVVISVSNDIPKSFIVTTFDNGNRIYLSPISCSTLRKRAQNILNYFKCK